MELQEKTLAQISKNGRGYYGIGASAVPFSEELYTYLRITDINDDGTLNMADLKSVADENAVDYLLEPNDIVFARTGASTGRNYFYDGSDGQFVYAGFLIKFALDEKAVNPRFIKYYCMSKPYWDWISAYNTGSTRGNINAQTLASMPISLPPRDYQDKVVSILDSIESKRKRNNEINDNLEQQASALIEDYCASTESTVELGQILSFENGFAFQSNTYLPAGRFRIITIKNVQDGKIDSQGAAFIEQIPDRMKPGCVLSIGDVLLSLTGNVGRVGIVCEEKLLLNQRVAKLIPKDPIILPWLYYYFRLPSSKVTLESIAKGTAQQNLSPVETLKLQVPFESSTALDLSKTLQPMFNQEIAGSMESIRLAAIRDALLPKLMSGELDVSDVEL